MARARLFLAALCVAALAAGCAGRSGTGERPPAAAPSTAPPATPGSTSPPAARLDWPTTPRSKPWPKTDEAAVLVAVALSITLVPLAPAGPPAAGPAAAGTPAGGLADTLAAFRRRDLAGGA